MTYELAELIPLEEFKASYPDMYKLLFGRRKTVPKEVKCTLSFDTKEVDAQYGLPAGALRWVSPGCRSEAIREQVTLRESLQAWLAEVHAELPFEFRESKGRLSVSSGPVDGFVDSADAEKIKTRLLHQSLLARVRDVVELYVQGSKRITGLEEARQRLTAALAGEEAERRRATLASVVGPHRHEGLTPEAWRSLRRAREKLSEYARTFPEDEVPEGLRTVLEAFQKASEDHDATYKKLEEFHKLERDLQSSGLLEKDHRRGGFMMMPAPPWWFR